MIRMLALMVVAAISMPVARAHASAPPPVCQLPTVIDVMARELRLNPHYTRIDPRVGLR